MPGLMKGIDDAGKNSPDPFHFINVVRIKHPEPPVKEKPKEKPEPPKKDTQRQINEKRLKQMIAHKLKLPFLIMYTILY